MRLQVLRKTPLPALAALLLFACGGGDDEPAPSVTPALQQPTESPAPSPTQPPATEAPASPTPEASDPEQAAVTDESVSFTTEDGLVLRGHLYSTPDATQRAVVFAHERPLDQTAWREFAREIAALGVAALTFDFRGYGESDGEQDLSKLAIDLAAALGFAEERDYAAVYLVGASMGGTAALIVAADQDIEGVVAVSAPPSIGGLDASQSVAAIEEAKLFIAGDQDASGFYAESVDFYMAVSGEPKESLILMSSAHGTVLFQGATAEAFRAALLEFLEL